MRWRHKPKQSNWGEFGPDDEVGRLNLITPEKVLQGIAEVREGRTFCLSLPLDYPGGNILHSARHPPKRRATTSPDGVKRYLLRLSGEDADLTDVVCDDQVTLHTQYSTQWDSLAHIGSEFDADGDGVAEKVFYNGYRAGEHLVAPNGERGSGARALGIENMANAGVQGRGVLLDLHAVYGREHAKV